MNCRVRTENGFHYVRFANGTPYVNCGVSGVVQPPAEEIPIDQNFFITLIDEAYPGYDGGNSGAIAGELWHLDVKKWNQTMSTFNNDACIIFDIGNRPKQILQKIWPETAVGNSQDNDCAIPINTNSIIDTSRPIKNDAPSQTALYNFLKTTIESKWGSNFWSRISATQYKLMIILDVSGSLDRTIVEEGLDAFESFLDSQNVNYREFGACANERWLSWISDIYNDPDMDVLAPCGSGCDISFVDANDNCLVRATVSVGFNQDGIPYSSGTGLNEYTHSENEIAFPYLDDEAVTYIYINPTLADDIYGSGTCADTIQLSVNKPCNVIPESYPSCYTIDPNTGSTYMFHFWGEAPPYSGSSFTYTDRWGAMLYCLGGQIFVHAVSYRYRDDANTTNFANGNPYGYEWYYGAVPVNQFGYPDGQVTFYEPDRVLTPLGGWVDFSGIYPAEASGVTVQVPNISFEYIGPTENLDINPCS
jgi:hypothetical protein